MHPCLTCGACCAHYRVSLHWLEAETLGTPDELTEAFGPNRLVMRGTWQPQPRCVALQGEVGRQAHCGIYAQRPSACREVIAAWEDGQPSPQCDRARQAHGMQPLTLGDWPA